ncbi:Mpv17 / PMP22 family [Musa troglodytarum]|uniref:Mpv17 / PMP22 family n=1 Tax=Musa troglodytarum TaxID=320322 RepID=A0A9E7KLL5_9LILI|nr:Mpv17 / PMP22 family [Musa troglodytarum]
MLLLFEDWWLTGIRILLDQPSTLTLLEAEGALFFFFLVFTDMSEIVTVAWQRYLQQLQAHPLRTKAITSGVLAGCSDAIAQKISGVKRLQLRRMFLLMLYGFVYSGPFGHSLHKFMEWLFKGKKGKDTVAKKVLLEQLTASPWNNMLFMTYYGLVLEGACYMLRHNLVGRSFSLVRRKIRKDYPSVQMTSWKFWPIVGWINYQYMPLQLRVLFHSFIASCWAVFLNLKAQSGAAKEA